MKNNGPELSAVGRLAPDPDWSMGPQVHANHEMIVVLSGSMHLELAEDRIVGGPGDVLLYRAGVRHVERSDPGNPVEIIYMAFQWDRVDGDMPARIRDIRGRIREIAVWLHQEFTSGERSDSTCGAFFNALIAEWLRLKEHRESPLVETIRSYVWRNISRRIDLERLAREAGLSKHHFVRTFRKLAGTTPMDYVRKMRVHYARGLIMTTGLPLKIIARLAGLGDEYRLSRVFMRVLGKRPGSLRT
ncbi:MAG: helix-turn-helix domain-containing protein [Planctomycetes bacterium]|nr:helix-turn-helix domain-containing protein [Planctomycetota bacterium]